MAAGPRSLTSASHPALSPCFLTGASGARHCLEPDFKCCLQVLELLQSEQPQAQLLAARLLALTGSHLPAAQRSADSLGTTVKSLAFLAATGASTCTKPAVRCAYDSVLIALLTRWAPP